MQKSNCNTVHTAQSLLPLRYLLAGVFILALCSIWQNGHAQAGTKVSVTTVDSLNLEPVNATIRFAAMNEIYKTDGKGVAHISLKAGNYIMIVSSVGYAIRTVPVTVTGGDAVSLIVTLASTDASLAVVTVTGTREEFTEVATRSNTPLRDIPQAIQVIPRQVLIEQQAYRLSDVFKNVAGVTEQSDYNYVNLRGFLSNASNFTLNGQRNNFFGLATSPQLPYAERIEVLKGPSSILYGNGAVGGIINIVTKKPKKEFGVNANLTGGSFGLVRAQADVTGALNKSKSLSGLLNIGFESGGSFYQDFKTTSVVITPVLTWAVGAKTELTSTTILRMANETSVSSGIPVIGTNNLFAVPVGFRYAADDSKFNTRSIQEQLSLRHAFSSRLSASIWLSAARRDVDINMYQPGGYSPRVDSITRIKAFYEGNLRGYTANAYLNYSATTGKVQHNIVLGVDYNRLAEYYPKGEKYWYAPVLNLASPNYRPFNTTGITGDYYDAEKEAYGPTRSVGIYLQDQVSFSEKLKAQVALRYDDYLNRNYFLISGTEYFDSSEATALVPKIGVVYQPVKSLSLYGSYSQAFQPQSSNSRAAGGPFPPLRAKQFEVGVKGEFLQKRLQPTVTVYEIRQANVLKPDPTDASGVRHVTTGEVTSRGLEVTLTGAITSRLNVLANYAKNNIFISKSTDPAEKGTGFGDTPKDAVSLWTTYRLGAPSNGLKIGFGYRYSAERNVYGLLLPAYTVIDGLIAYQYKKIGLAVNGFNLADKRYSIGSFGTSYHFPGAPRNIQVSASYNL